MIQLRSPEENAAKPSCQLRHCVVVPATPTTLPVCPPHFLNSNASCVSQCPLHQPKLFSSYLRPFRDTIPTHHHTAFQAYSLLFPFPLNKPWPWPQKLGHTILSFYFSGFCTRISLCMVLSPSFNSQETLIHPSIPSSEGASSGLNTEHLQ